MVMSSPLAKPSRRSTLLGLRRKSSASDSLTPSESVDAKEKAEKIEKVESASPVPPPATVAIEETPVPSTPPPAHDGQQVDEPTGANEDAGSTHSKTEKKEDAAKDSRRSPKPKRMFTILTNRAANGGRVSTEVILNHGAETSEGGDSDLSRTGSVSSSNFFSKLAKSEAHKRLEEQAQTLTTEKAALEASLEAANAENARLKAEAEKNAADWEAEKQRVKEESVVQRLALESQIKALSDEITELRQKAKEAEEEIVAVKTSTATELEIKLAEKEAAVLEVVQEEKKALESKVVAVETALNAKEEALKTLETDVTGLKEKLAPFEAAAAKKAAKSGCTIM